MNPAPQVSRAARPRPLGEARKLRIRYAVAGVVMALTWMGEGGEPAWAHALRTSVILLIVPPLLLRSNRRLTQQVYEAADPRWAIARLITVRTAIVGGALVAAYLLGCLLDPHSAQPAASLGVRLLVVLLTVPLQIRLAHRTRTSEVHPSAGPVLSAPRLIAAKLTLIIAALLAQMLLDGVTHHADVIVAVAIAVAAAGLGPKIHARLLVAPPAAGAAPVSAAVRPREVRADSCSP
ncbi:hypothetical protein GCM10010211_40640 [Streptomyces albospinus]|uniref:Integral membrane protein n=1 Tax=Streptomyces albospinus TaxID=285515 RepID=A0ABQ2V6V3_9ACTN|nr:hypothetical protein [Streptomyces albospinus]GGU70810.1 hypothetical protein GCM10010211_40640 [Streptomyces albospinus]